jgi:hypothetical protein
MTLQLTLVIVAGRLQLSKYDISDVVSNPKNPKKMYYRVNGLIGDLSGGYESFQILYHRKITFETQFLARGSLYDIQNISSNHLSTLFQQHHLVTITKAMEFIPTAEKTELPLFMMRSTKEMPMTVEFCILFKNGSRDILTAHNGETLQLSLELYTD